MVKDARCPRESPSVCCLTIREARHRRGKVAPREVRSLSRGKLTLGDVDVRSFNALTIGFGKRHATMVSASSALPFLRESPPFLMLRVGAHTSLNYQYGCPTLYLSLGLLTPMQLFSCSCAPLILLSLPSTSFSGSRSSFPVHIRRSQLCH